MSKCRECARYDRTKNICCLTKSNILNPNDDQHCVYWLKRRQLLFDRMMASPEVLAPNLVYFVSTSWGEAYWTSTITEEKEFESYEKAIAATVAKLKEVCNE